MLKDKENSTTDRGMANLARKPVKQGDALCVHVADGCFAGLDAVQQGGPASPFSLHLGAQPSSVLG